MTGRRIAHYTVAGVSGNWKLDVRDYAAGMYMVTLREGGKVLLQSKLAITH